MGLEHWWIRVSAGVLEPIPCVCWGTIWVLGSNGLCGLLTLWGQQCSRVNCMFTFATITTLWSISMLVPISLTGTKNLYRIQRSMFSFALSNVLLHKMHLSASSTLLSKTSYICLVSSVRRNPVQCELVWGTCKSHLESDLTAEVLQSGKLPDKFWWKVSWDPLMWLGGCVLKSQCREQWQPTGTDLRLPQGLVWRAVLVRCSFFYMSACWKK